MVAFDSEHPEYCWFSVSRQSTSASNRIQSRIWKKKEGKYAKPLAKIQVTAIFLKQDMKRNVFPKFIEICMEPPR